MEFEGQEESTFASVAQANQKQEQDSESSEWIEVTKKNDRSNSEEKEEESKDETPATGAEKKKRKRNNKKKIAISHTNIEKASQVYSSAWLVIIDKVNN